MIISRYGNRFILFVQQPEEQIKYYAHLWNLKSQKEPEEYNIGDIIDIIITWRDEKTKKEAEETLVKFSPWDRIWEVIQE